MSFLRVVRQGQPIDPALFVDLGPATGRITHSRGMARDYGTLVVAESERTRSKRLQREAMARQRSLAVEPEPARPVRKGPPCGKWMILARTECARKSRHNGSCATRASMDAENRSDRKR